MNPFSKYLRQFTTDREFDAFVAQWDVLESTVIGVYRQKMTIEQAQADFTTTWPKLRQAYPQWEPRLRPYWQATRAAGEPTQIDPFQLLLSIPNPKAIQGDWNAMQHLPAAREALNRYLVDRAANQ